MTVYCESALVAVIERVLQTGRPQSLLVVAALPYTDAFRDRMLERFPDVGFILDDSGDRGGPSHPRIGRRCGATFSYWEFPACKYRDVLVAGTPDDISIRALVMAIRGGVREFLFPSPASDRIVRVSAIWLTAVTVRRRAPAILRHILHRIGGLIQNVVGPFAALPLVETLVPLLTRVFMPPVRLSRRAVRRRRDKAFEARLERLFTGADRIRDHSSADPRRVALAVGTVGPGGSERQVVNTALALVASGQYEPVVMCSNLSHQTSGFYSPLLERAGVELVDLKARGTPRLGEADHRLIEVARSALSEAAYDISEDVLRFLAAMLVMKPAVVHAFLDDTNIKAGIAAVLAGVPRVILSFRSVAPNNFALHTPFMRPAYNALRRRSTVLFTANSSIGAEDYRRWLRASDLPITIIRNGVDFSDFAQCDDEVRATERAKYGVPAGVKVLGSIMRMSEEKQPLRWAEVALDISRRMPDVHFILAGDGPMRPQVVEFLSNGRIARRVHLPGHVRDIASMLKCMDVFLLTSRLEGLPNVLIEAQAMGVPVVTTPAGGAVEALRDGVTGIVCSDWTAASISDACVRILADESVRKRLSEAGPAYVRQAFGVDRMLGETLAIYKS